LFAGTREATASQRGSTAVIQFHGGSPGNIGEISFGGISAKANGRAIGNDLLRYEPWNGALA
jgi:hypothetical protein